MGVEIECDECYGTGEQEINHMDPYTEMRPCSKCHGKKEVTVEFEEHFCCEISDLSSAIEDFVAEMQKADFTKTEISEGLIKQVRNLIHEHNK